MIIQGNSDPKKYTVESRLITFYANRVTSHTPQGILNPQIPIGL